MRRAAPAVACAAGALVALAVAVLPQWRFEAAIAASGLGEFLAAARPPLGATARAVLALAAGGSAAGLVLAAAFCALRLLPRAAARAPDADLPVLRRADAHPDAPARRPLRASEDLGRPLPLGAIEEPAAVPPETVGERMTTRDVPADLDTPLAAFDPAAIPAVPREPVRPVAPLVRPALVDAHDRMETFELTPLRRAPVAAIAPRERQPVQPTSLAALLERLEQGATRRAPRQARSLEETLGALRALAAR